MNHGWVRPPTGLAWIVRHSHRLARLRSQRRQRPRFQHPFRAAASSLTIRTNVTSSTIWLQQGPATTRSRVHLPNTGSIAVRARATRRHRRALAISPAAPQQVAICPLSRANGYRVRMETQDIYRVRLRACLLVKTSPALVISDRPFGKLSLITPIFPASFHQPTSVACNRVMLQSLGSPSNMDNICLISCITLYR